jgi:hypothetical protein
MGQPPETLQVRGTYLGLVPLRRSLTDASSHRLGVELVQVHENVDISGFRNVASSSTQKTFLLLMRRSVVSFSSDQPRLSTRGEQ